MFSLGVLLPAPLRAAPYGAGQSQYASPPVPAAASLSGREFFPDGFRDDAVNRAIAAASAAGGGDVMLAEGVYLLGGKVLLKPGVSLVGRGAGKTILRRVAPFAFESVDGDATAVIEAVDQGLRNIVLRGFTVDGNWSEAELLELKPNVAGIRISSSRNYYNDTITIDSVEITNCACGLLAGGVTNLTVAGCRLHHNGPHTLWHNLYLRRVGAVRISGCEISGALAGSGLKIVGETRTIGQESRDLIITGNKMENNFRNNCYISGFENVLIEDNAFNGQRENATAEDGRPSGLYMDLYNTSVDVINNIFKNNANHGFHATQTARLNVSGNYAAANGGGGYNLHGNTAPFACDDNTDAPVPEITGLSPALLSPGGAVAIAGGGFIKVEGVLFGGLPLDRHDYSADSPGVINATVPALVADSGRVTVRTAFGQAESPEVFHTRRPPAITAPPPSLVAVAGGQAGLTAGVSGHPEPEVAWEFSTDGRAWNTLEPGGDYTISGDGKTLAITGGADNAGWQFRFRAGNGSGPEAVSAAVTLAVMADVLGGPAAVYIDAAGELYIADETRHVIQRVTGIASGSGAPAVFAGTPETAGATGGTGTSARFFAPAALAAHGNVLYVADRLNNAIRTVTAGGGTGVCAGRPGAASETLDGTPDAARFAGPAGLAIDGDGNIYVSDSETNAIRLVRPGESVETIAGEAGRAGADDGPGNLSTFNNPRGLALDEAGAVLYIADADNHLVRTLARAGSGWAAGTLAGVAGGAGWRDGDAAQALFRQPRGLAVSGGTLFVADSGNHAIRAVDLSTGSVSTVAGAPAETHAAELRNGRGADARFYLPSGLALDAAGNLYIADGGNGAIRHVDLGDDNRVDTLVLNPLPKAGAGNPASPPPGNSNAGDGGGGGGGGTLMSGPASMLALLWAARLLARRRRRPGGRAPAPAARRHAC
jgi:sugar lactone lactonase YvrE